MAVTSEDCRMARPWGGTVCIAAGACSPLMSPSRSAAASYPMRAASGMTLESGG